ncbi:MAG: hypothetical protein P8O00_06660 [Candidatus Marinimicrobia bacterium]|nr:hypothetical protein [Candidatus Neomarinimicrobiota bacterium]
MISDNYKRRTALFVSLFLFSFSFSQEKEIIVDLKNGNKITGSLVAKTDSTYKLNTEFGELVIPIDDVDSINNKKITKSIENNQNSSIVSQDNVVKKPLNQEARWRTIYGAMTIGNILYGEGIPYLFNLEQTSEQYVGFKLLAFATSYSLSSSYTRTMDLPLGRSYLQFAGANLGFYSIIPIISMIGLENWGEFDPDGKIALGYTMFSVPYGAILADKTYKKWKLSNGQSFLISLGINLGALNTIGVIQQTDWLDWFEKNPENFARWTTSLVYAGALAGGKLAKNIALNNSSITEGDVAFLNLSMGLGYLNSLLLGYAMDINHYKDQTMLTIAGVNGFLYLADRLNKKYGSLTQGQEKIVGLGAGSAYLAWVGTALITGIDYGERSSRFLDVASITAGWYFSRKNISSDVSSESSFIKNDMALTINPTLLPQNKTLAPGVSINFTF